MCSVLDKLATQYGQIFQLHLNNVATLPCKTRDTIEFLRRETPDFIGPELWPANSPDLNPVDYRIWGLMQERVYQSPMQDVDDLKQWLISVWAEFKQSIINKAIDQWRPRLRACVHARGQHFEQLID